MSRWFRHYAGMMRDDKLVRAALKAGQSIERVVWVWGAILESAAEIDDGGRFDFDANEAAYFLRADATDMVGIIDALTGMGRIRKNIVVKWRDRQFQSDRSAGRQRRLRQKPKRPIPECDGDASVVNDGQNRNVTGPSRDGDVTAHGRHGDAPETETEAEAETEKIDDVECAREPLDLIGHLSAFQRILTEIGATTDDPNWPAQNGRVRQWLANGWDLDLDILPTVRRIHADRRAKSKSQIKRLEYFEQAIADCFASRTAPVPIGRPEARRHAEPNRSVQDVARELYERACREDEPQRPPLRAIQGGGTGDDPAWLLPQGRGGGP